MEGHMTQIGLNDDDYVVSSRIWLDMPDIVNLTLWKVSTEDGDSESLEYLEDWDAPLGGTVMFETTTPSVEIRVEHILEGDDSRRLLAKSSVPGECCVTCPSGDYVVRVCGCAVSADCGTCCVDPCCQ